MMMMTIMIPLMPTVALAFFSLCCSAFVILRIAITILPRRYLGRRVYPLAFSHPKSHSLPPADKSYVWLALCDIFAVSIFVWEAFDQWSGPASTRSGAAVDIGTGTGTIIIPSAAGAAESRARLWLALTLRQTCFLVISALILVHVRMRKSVSLGFAHWFLWVPLALLACASTTAIVVVAATTAGFKELSRGFVVGYVVYSFTIALLSTAIFGSLVRSLIVIRRSLLANFNNNNNNYYYRAKESESESVTLAAEEIDAIREGSEWIASTASSRRSASSKMTTTRTRATRSSGTRATTASTTSPERTTPPQFPIWPPQSYSTSPQSRRRSPSLPRRGDAYATNDFGQLLRRHRTQSLRAAALTLGSSSRGSTSTSWMISSSLGGTHTTLSAWSYPASTTAQRSHPSSDWVRSAPTAPAATIAEAPPAKGPSLGKGGSQRLVAGGVVGGVRVRVLGDNRYAPSAGQAERAASAPAAAAPSPQIEISALRILAWLAGVWVPLALSLPYIIIGFSRTGSSSSRSSEFASTLLAIGVAISSPILALNLLLRHPIPIPNHHIFDAPPQAPGPRATILRYMPPMVGSAASTEEGCSRRGVTAGRGRGRCRSATGSAWLIKGGSSSATAVDVDDEDEKGYYCTPRLLSVIPKDDGDGDAKGKGKALVVQSRNWRHQGAHFPPSPPAPVRVGGAAPSPSLRRSRSHPALLLTR